ncbi:MAG TPA: T9SS type A sorting domain-containing protein [Bacteroidota bacterium]|jgi:hypothetical protein|nr:T9SS type A sorting domain-containing protein [Bacteroidota bacterium]
MKKMMIISIMVLIPGLCSTLLLAQTINWERQFDYGQNQDVFTAVTVNTNGSVFATGFSKISSTDIEYVTQKLYANGNYVATQLYSTGTINQAAGISVKNGYLYVTGRSKVSTTYRLATLQNDTGNSNKASVVYHRNSTSNDYGQFVLPNNGSGDTIYVSGTSRIASPANADAVLLKYSSTASGLTQVGSAVIFDAFGANNDDTLKAMAVDANNNVYLTTKSYEGALHGWDIYTAKYDRSLNFLWKVAYAGSGTVTDEPNGLYVDASGNVYVTGSSGSNAVTIKYNSSGAQQWASTYTNGLGNDVRVFNNAVYMTGTTLSSGNPQYALTVKYDASGTQSWAKTYTGGCSCTYTVGYKIRIDTTGNAIYVGGGYEDMVFLKYDSSGTAVWNTTYNGPSQSVDQVYDMVADKSGNLVTAGYVREGVFGPSPNDEDFQLLSLQVGGGFSSKAAFISPTHYASREETPSDYSLFQNFPNPFNPTTIIRYSLPEDGPVVMKIYDMLGREVRTIMDGQQILKGMHEVNFNGVGLSSGVYFYRIQAGNGKFNEVRRMMILK